MTKTMIFGCLWKWKHPLTIKFWGTFFLTHPYGEPGLKATKDTNIPEKHAQQTYPNSIIRIMYRSITMDSAFICKIPVNAFLYIQVGSFIPHPAKIDTIQIAKLNKNCDSNKTSG